MASFATINVVALPVSLYQQLSGGVNALGWSTVLIFLVLAAGYLYFTFSRETVRDSMAA